MRRNFSLERFFPSKVSAFQLISTADQNLHNPFENEEMEENNDENANGNYSQDDDDDFYDNGNNDFYLEKIRAKNTGNFYSEESQPENDSDIFHPGEGQSEDENDDASQKKSQHQNLSPLLRPEGLFSLFIDIQ